MTSLGHCFSISIASDSQPLQQCCLVFNLIFDQAYGLRSPLHPLFFAVSIPFRGSVRVRRTRGGRSVLPRRPPTFLFRAGGAHFWPLKSVPIALRYSIMTFNSSVKLNRNATVLSDQILRVPYCVHYFFHVSIPFRTAGVFVSAVVVGLCCLVDRPFYLGKEEHTSGHRQVYRLLYAVMTFNSSVN